MFGNCPKISYTSLCDKMAYANSADPDRTVSSAGVYTGCNSTKYFVKVTTQNKKKLGKKIE